jgi:hypothetical protein
VRDILLELHRVRAIFDQTLPYPLKPPSHAYLR